MNGEQIKPGYKRTEAGMIPEDWGVRSFGELTATVASGRSKVGIAFGNYPVYGSTGVIGFCEKPEYEGDAILIARVGANAGKINTVTGKYGVTDNTIIVRVKSDSSLSFFHRQLENKRLNSLVFGSGQPLITGSQLKALAVCDPPLPEQRAIATALSDVDALLAKIDQLIAKKRDLKQATMQQLLTGQTRLPGFSGEWEMVALRNLLLLKATYGIVTAGDFKSAGVPMVRGGDIKGGQVGYDLPIVSPEKSSEYSRTVLIRDDVVIALVGYPGEAAKVPSRLEGANISRAVGLIRLNKAVTPDYLVSYLNSPIGRRMVLAPSAGSAQLVVNLADLNKLVFPLPSLSEQTAISTVLTDMDGELAALEARRDKTRAFKQGMMQELLTGRVRLI